MKTWSEAYLAELDVNMTETLYNPLSANSTSGALTPPPVTGGDDVE